MNANGNGAAAFTDTVTPVSSITGSPRVLVLGDSSTFTNDLALAKTDLGYSGTMTFTTKNIYGGDSGYTGSDITTSNYDVVFFYGNGGNTPSSALGSNLNTYVSSGGKMIMGVFAWGNPPALPGLDYSICSTYLYSGTQGNDAGSITAVIAHPIFNGIDNTIGISSFVTPSIALQSGATGIGRFPSTNWFLAVKESGSTKLVGINMYPPSGWNNGNSDKNKLRYMVNSIYWCIGSLV